MLALLTTALFQFTSTNALCIADVRTCADGTSLSRDNDTCEFPICAVYTPKCLDGVYNCIEDPCLSDTVGCGNYVCQADYCGGCNKVYTDDEGYVIPDSLCEETCTDSIVSCFAAPCLTATCSIEGARCMDNYCGGCNAVWLDEYGNDITERCATTDPCTDDERLCVDGTYVSRDADTCEFPCEECTEEFVQCIDSPCFYSTCSVDGATCTDNYCGGCNAVWTDVEGNDITATCDCAEGIFECFADPCSVSTCSIDGAECVSDYCGGCNAIWYDADGNDITTRCESATTDAPCSYITVVDPVCCDGETYTNSGHAACECDSYVNADSYTDGACTDATTETPCSYIDLDDPVCCDGTTYENTGHAGCECDSYVDGDATTYTEGECEDDDEVCEAPDDDGSCSDEVITLTLDFNVCHIAAYSNRADWFEDIKACFIAETDLTLNDIYLIYCSLADITSTSDSSPNYSTDFIITFCTNSDDGCDLYDTLMEIGDTLQTCLNTKADGRASVSNGNGYGCLDDFSASLDYVNQEACSTFYTGNGSMLNIRFVAFIGFLFVALLH